MSVERQTYFKMKNSIKKEIYHQADTATLFMEEMGLRETKNEDFKKLAFKYTTINKRDSQVISVLGSIHSIGLQRSDYLQIDNKLIYDMHQNPNKLHEDNEVEDKQQATINRDEEKDPVYLRYVDRREVNRKRHMFLILKAQFQAKMAKLKSLG